MVEPVTLVATVSMDLLVSVELMARPLQLLSLRPVAKVVMVVGSQASVSEDSVVMVVSIHLMCLLPVSMVVMLLLLPSPVAVVVVVVPGRFAVLPHSLHRMVAAVELVVCRHASLRLFPVVVSTTLPVHRVILVVSVLLVVMA